MSTHTHYRDRDPRQSRATLSALSVPCTPPPVDELRYWRLERALRIMLAIAEQGLVPDAAACDEARGALRTKELG